MGGREVANPAVAGNTRPLNSRSPLLVTAALSGAFLLVILAAAGPLAACRPHPTDLAALTPLVVEVHDLAALTPAEAANLDAADH